MNIALLIASFVLTFSQLQDRSVNPAADWRSKVDHSLVRIHEQFSSTDQSQLSVRGGKSGIRMSAVFNISDKNQVLEVGGFLIFEEAPKDFKRLEKLGVTVRSQVNEVVTATFGLDILPQIASLAEIKGVIPGRRLGSATDAFRSQPELAHSLAGNPGPSGRIQEELGLTGKGVIIGIIDTGINYQHRDFQKLLPDGTWESRILAFWNQRSSEVSPGSEPWPYTYGKEWKQDDISDCIASMGGFACDGLIDDTGHGTAVAGVAAGNGNVDPVKIGAAPDAELVIIRAEEGYPDDELVDALAYIVNLAKQEDKPWAINLSFGAHYGPHDGTYFLDELIADIVDPFGIDNGKGRVVAAGAGNDFWTSSFPDHLWRRVHHKGEAGTFEVFFTSGGLPSDEEVRLQIWFPGSESYTIQLQSPTGSLYPPSPISSGPFIEFWEDETSDGYVSILVQEDLSTNPNYSGTNSGLIEIDINDGISDLRSGKWKFHLTSSEQYFPEEYDAWIVWDKYKQNPLQTAYVWSSPYKNSRIVVSPASSRNVIGVGAHAASGLMASYSSNGPNRPEDPFIGLERSKPDIIALGSHEAADVFGLYSSVSGTSFSSPVVTGLAAQLLELRGFHFDSNLDWEDVKFALTDFTRAIYQAPSDILDSRPDAESAEWYPKLTDYGSAIVAIKRDARATVYENNAVLSTVHLDGESLWILPGVEVEITNSLHLGDYFGRPSEIHVAKGAKLLLNGTSVTCDPGGEIFVHGGDLDVNTNNYQTNCFNSCIVVENDGKVTFRNNIIQEFSNGAFLANMGGTIIVEDNSQIIYRQSAKPLLIDAGSVFKLGANAKIVAERKVDIIGSPQDPIVFEKNGSQMWGEVELRGSYSKIHNVRMTGAYSAIKVAADAIDINNVEISDGHHGVRVVAQHSGGGDSRFTLRNSDIYNNYNGVHVHRGSAQISSSTIRNNTNYGIYLSSSEVGSISSNEVSHNKTGLHLYNTWSELDAAFESNYVHDNSQFGISLSPNSTLYAFDSFSNISNNGSHEVYVGSPTARFYLSDTVLGLGGYSDIFDNSSSGKLIYNSAKTWDGSNYIAWTVPATDVYWGTTNPSSSLFGGGPVDYTPYLTSSPATGPGGQYKITNSVIALGDTVSTLQDMPANRSHLVLQQVVSGRGDDRLSPLAVERLSKKIQELRSRIGSSLSDPANARHILSLYYLLLLDLSDQTEEWSNTLSFFESIKTLRPGASSKLATESLVLVEILEAIRQQKFKTAIYIADRAVDKTKNHDIVSEIMLLKAIALESIGEYKRALAAIDIAEAVPSETDFTRANYLSEKENLLLLIKESGGQDVGNFESLSAVTELDVNQIESISTSAYPNPFRTSFTIKLEQVVSNEAISIVMVDLLGRIVLAKEHVPEGVGSQEIILDTSDLASGSYFYRVLVGNQVFARGKAVKNR